MLNYDDAPTRALAGRTKGRVMFFSRQEILPEGVFVKDGNIVVKPSKDLAEEVVLPLGEVFIPGNHNIENALAATAVAYFGGVSIPAIAKGLKAFRGVAHRIEWVGEVNDVVFYNDSKGTNPDASIVAVKAMTRPTILIAGGMDKGSEFDTFIESFGSKIKQLVVFGETAECIEKTARDMGYLSVTRVNDLNEAVDLSFELSEPGDAILLSPACASWDMYPSFEHRGDHFKECFENIRRR